MNEMEYWKVLQTMVAKIRSGHTHVSLSNETSRQQYTSPHLLLPFTVYTENNRLYVKNHIKADSLLKSGSEILVINNEYGTSILKQMQDFVSGDGYSTSFKDFNIEYTFNQLYNLLHGDQEQFLITFKYKGAIKTKLFKATKFTPHFAVAERLPTVTNPQFYL
jgi:hypothetical protein